MMMMMMTTVQRSNAKNKKKQSSLSRSGTRRSASFFINIGISHPKIRIQLPKLLVRTMQRPRRDPDEPKKPGKTLPKKVFSMLSSVFGSKKSKGSVSSEVEKMGMGWFKSTGKGKCVYCGIKTVGVGSLCKPHSLLKAFQADDLRGPQKIVPAISRQESSRRLARVSSSVSSRRRMRRAKSVRKKVEKERQEDDEEGEENNGNELCNKRILMGGKCKPVDFSESVDFDYFSGDRYWRYS